MNRRFLQSLTILFLLLHSSVFSKNDEEDLNHLPTAHLMPIATEYPFVLFDQNRYSLLENPEIIIENQKAIHFNLRSEIFPWLVLIGFAIAGFCWALYVARKHNHNMSIHKAEELSLSQKFALAFADIQKNRWIENNKFQLLYPKLEELMHAFLSIQNKEMTSREYEKALAYTSRFSLNEKKKIKHYLHAFDAIKFGGKVPSAEESKQTAKEIYDLLQSQL